MSLFVLGGVGAGIVFEEREVGKRVPVHILRGPEAARRWTEAHYEGVDWASPHSAIAAIGRLSGPLRLSRSGAESMAREHGRVTYQTAELRTYLPELVAGRDGPMIVQRCEEFVVELDRWERYDSVLWQSS